MRSVRALAAAAALLTASTALAQRADAVLVVNSGSARHGDAKLYVQPYLDHFGVPYTILDIATQPITADIGQYALIIIGHAELDVSHGLLDASEQDLIAAAVAAGTGLVSFESDLTADGSTGLYRYVDTIFGFGYQNPAYPLGIYFTADGASHYVGSNHAANSSVNAGQMLAATVTPSAVK